jgi:hypothetical protein
MGESKFQGIIRDRMQEGRNRTKYCLKQFRAITNPDQTIKLETILSSINAESEKLKELSRDFEVIIISSSAVNTFLLKVLNNLKKYYSLILESYELVVGRKFLKAEDFEITVFQLPNLVSKLKSYLDYFLQNIFEKVFNMKEFKSLANHFFIFLDNEKTHCRNLENVNSLKDTVMLNENISEESKKLFLTILEMLNFKISILKTLPD